MTFPLGSSWPYKNQRKPCDVFANVALFHENGQTHFDKNVILLCRGRKHYTVKPRFWNTSWSAANGIPESSIIPKSR